MFTIMTTVENSYVSLYESGDLAKRTDRLYQRLACCDLCPRNCKINRIEGELGYCRSGKEPVVASYCDHHGEEPPISGRHGSGTIFFGNCNLRCVFCQNYLISQHYHEQKQNIVSTRELAGIMLELQSRGCHNINFVSPSHFVPQLCHAVYLAVPQGLKIPIVYNTSSYDSLDTLYELDGIVSVYLPDLKYASDEKAKRYSDATDYNRYARVAIKEMYQQTGRLVTGHSGLAVSGVLVRHLVLPGNIAGTRECLAWLANEVSNDVGLSLMSQYHPCHRAFEYPELAKTVEADEYVKALKQVKELGFKKTYIQGLGSPQVYLPDFSKEKPFGA